jgi:hypothetical protein
MAKIKLYNQGGNVIVEQNGVKLTNVTYIKLNIYITNNSSHIVLTITKTNGTSIFTNSTCIIVDLNGANGYDIKGTSSLGTQVTYMGTPVNNIQVLKYQSTLDCSIATIIVKKV